MSTFHSFAKVAILFACLAALSVTALAADNAAATVTIPSGCLQPVAIQSNGAATGTIQILYTYVGNTFPAGYFGCFNLNLAVAAGKGSQHPTYPATITSGQIGGENVILTTANPILPVTGIGSTGTLPYIVSINPSVQADPTLNEDGDVIVGNLRLQASDTQLSTVTNIQVKIQLFHPSGPCLKVSHEILNKETFLTVPSMEVDVHANGKNVGLIYNSDPSGIYDSVLVVNTCAVKQPFDLKFAPPTGFFDVQTGDPGNSIKVYTAGGEQTFTYFKGLDGAGMGTDFCVGNLEVAANYTLLATTALKVRDGVAGASLPTTGVFDFNASLVTAGTACGGTAIVSLPTLELDFTKVTK